MTMKSALSASRLRAVSLSVSPFLNDEASAEKFTMSAVSRCAASSKLMRVRVDGSMNKLTTVLPRNAGTFLIARPPPPLNALAVSSTVTISSPWSDSMSSRCLRFQLILFCQHDLVRQVWNVQPHAHFFRNGGRHIFADVICLDGQFAMATVTQHCELDFFWPAKIVERIHRGARRATGEQHVVHQHHGFTGHIERHDGRMNGRRGALTQIIAVHAHIQNADGNGQFPDFRQNFSKPECELVAHERNTHQHDLRADFVALGDLVRDARERALDGGGVKDDGGFRHKKSRTRSAGRSRFAWCVGRSYFPSRPRRAALKEQILSVQFVAA